ncbi:kinase-like domain-containing protein [Gongronella butleri]|nr:kinase-like domain-containing protein [Gongronella butleri]
MRRSRFIVRHHRAAALPAPLASGHQYYWISSPALGRNSLHYLLHHDAATVDAREHTFLVLSVQSILRGVAKVHAADYCHLGLSPRSFFYEQASTITDWLLSGFYQAYVLGQNDGHPLYLDVYSAPELIVASVVSDDHQDVMLLCHRFRAQFEMDAWSVGCILYQLLTGEPLFKDIMQLRVLCGMDPATSTDLQNHLDKAFQHPALNDFPPVTQKLLNVDPQLRIPVSHILREWVEVHSLAEYQ